MQKKKKENLEFTAKVSFSKEAVDAIGEAIEKEIAKSLKKHFNKRDYSPTNQRLEGASTD